MSADATVPAVSTTDLAQYVNCRVTVTGWVQRVRALGGVTFVVVRDGCGIVQVANHPGDNDMPWLSAESVVAVSGLVSEEPRAPGGMELRQPTVSVITSAQSPVPINLGVPELREGLDVVLNHRSISLRHPLARTAFRVQDRLCWGFRQALARQRFVEIHTPKLIARASESGASVFGVDFFGRPAYLAQSPQMYKQVMVGVFDRVFEIGPVFRAEPHDTGRHLSEYVSLDAEMGFITDHRTVMAVLAEVIGQMLAAAEPEARNARGTWPRVPADFPAIDFADALRLVGKAQGQDLWMSRIWLLRTSSGWASGPDRNFTPTFCLWRAIRWPLGRSTPIPTPKSRGEVTRLTCCFADRRLSPGVSGSTGWRTTSARCKNAGSVPRGSPAISRRLPMACRPTADSRSDWSA